MACHFHETDVGDRIAGPEIECLEVQTLSCHCFDSFVGDIIALCDDECLEVRNLLRHIRNCIIVDGQARDVERLEVLAPSSHLHHPGFGDCGAILKT